MEQIVSARGHVVFVRCPTSPPSWEAACACGFRSARYHSETDARDAGLVHAEEAPEFKRPKAKAKRTKKRARR